MAKQKRQSFEAGQFAEKLVALGLKGRGWQILEERWLCEKGEIDLIALDQTSSDKVLVFIEVKARRQKNWDDNGLLSIDIRKQIKISQAASLYLAFHPEYESFACRFDVALVQITPASSTNSEVVTSFPELNVGGDRLKLYRYIPNAFEAITE